MEALFTPLIISPPQQFVPLSPPRKQFLCSSSTSCLSYTRSMMLESSSSLKHVDHDTVFAMQMQAAGILPDQRVGVAISGGVDSMALAILISRWRHSVAETQNKLNTLTAFVVDHALRSESRAEATMVQKWLSDLGMKCEILKCCWKDGIPAQGHLQEAARNARYKLLQEACRKNGLDILLTAHHEDDQVELFLIRLSRCSGVAGLACMPFTSQLFPDVPEYTQYREYRSLLLVRPLLVFSKEDLYHICREAGQSWVEDPTNKNTVFVRNRVRKMLQAKDPYSLKRELLDVISICRRTRALLDMTRNGVLSEAVSINVDYGFSLLDLQKLENVCQNDAVLSRVIVELLQFVSQKCKPSRGRMVQILIDSIHNKTLKGALTLGGCHVSIYPSSKGSKLLICTSVESPLPLDSHSLLTLVPGPCLSPSSIPLYCGPKHFLNETSHLGSNFQFKNAKTSIEGIIEEARVSSVLSEASSRAITQIVDEISSNYSAGRNVNVIPSLKGLSLVESSRKTSAGHVKECLLELPLGRSCYFASRFFISWGKKESHERNLKESGCITSRSVTSGLGIANDCYLMQEKMTGRLRFLNEKDWMQLSYLASLKPVELSTERCICNPENWKHGERSFNQGLKLKSQQGKLSDSDSIHVQNWVERFPPLCGDSISRVAREASLRLKNIPIPVRKGLPVLTAAHGALLCIPSLKVSLCPHIWSSSIFMPRIPLGGSNSSWVSMESLIL